MSNLSTASGGGSPDPTVYGIGNHDPLAPPEIFRRIKGIPLGESEEEGGEEDGEGGEKEGEEGATLGRRQPGDRGEVVGPGWLQSGR